MHFYTNTRLLDVDVVQINNIARKRRQEEFHFNSPTFSLHLCHHSSLHRHWSQQCFSHSFLHRYQHHGYKRYTNAIIYVASIIPLASALLHYYLWCFPLTKTIKNGCTKNGEKKNSSSITWQHRPNVERQEKERETKRMGKCMHTIRATLPDVSLHLEVAILRAEMHISSQHHLHIGLLLREHHRNVTALYR
jgi:hypothetical protein